MNFAEMPSFKINSVIFKWLCSQFFFLFILIICYMWEILRSPQKWKTCGDHWMFHCVKSKRSDHGSYKPTLTKCCTISKQEIWQMIRAYKFHVVIRIKENDPNWILCLCVLPHKILLKSLTSNNKLVCMCVYRVGGGEFGWTSVWRPLVCVTHKSVLSYGLKQGLETGRLLPFFHKHLKWMFWDKNVFHCIQLEEWIIHADTQSFDLVVSWRIFPIHISSSLGLGGIHHSAALGNPTFNLVEVNLYSTLIADCIYSIYQSYDKGLH